MINEHTQLVTSAPERRINAVAVAEKAHRVLPITANPAEIMQIEAQLDLVERLMRETGFYPLDEIRPVNEARMRARWRLGAALESVVKDKPGPKPQGVTSTGLMQFLKQIELDHQTALEARRIAALPDKNFQEAIEQWRARDDLLHYDDLLHISKPFWTLGKSARRPIGASPRKQRRPRSRRRRSSARSRCSTSIRLGPSRHIRTWRQGCRYRC